MIPLGSVICMTEGVVSGRLTGVQKRCFVNRICSGNPSSRKIKSFGAVVPYMAGSSMFAGNTQPVATTIHLRFLSAMPYVWTGPWPLPAKKRECDPSWTVTISPSSISRLLCVEFSKVPSSHRSLKNGGGQSYRGNTCRLPPGESGPPPLPGRFRVFTSFPWRSPFVVRGNGIHIVSAVRKRMS